MIGGLLLLIALQAPAQAKSASRKSAVRQPPRVAVITPGTRRAVARVVVDAGHGGVDPGAPMANGGGLREKDITLQIALKVGDALKQRGVDVIYTRKTDTLIALADRGKIANQAGGDMFVSIHVNAA